MNVSVVGLGRAGPLAESLAETDVDAIGFEVDKIG